MARQSRTSCESSLFCLSASPKCATRLLRSRNASRAYLASGTSGARGVPLPALLSSARRGGTTTLLPMAASLGDLEPSWGRPVAKSPAERDGLCRPCAPEPTRKGTQLPNRSLAWSAGLLGGWVGPLRSGFFGSGHIGRSRCRLLHVVLPHSGAAEVLAFRILPAPVLSRRKVRPTALSAGELLPPQPASAALIPAIASVTR